MGEPIFTSKAHVFQIDPETKRKWITCSAQAVNVSFYHDRNRQIYRIISIEGSKILINSTIVPSMTFTKTSQKFGQWTDTKAGTVYGLGFSSDKDLLKFVEKFNDLKDAASRTANEQPQDGLSESLQINSLLASRESGSFRTVTEGRVGPGEEDVTPTPSPIPSGPDSQSVEKLRYENERLMVALTQSRANAKKWEVELQTLRNNNLRLNAALVESTTNVEQWKEQLMSLKEENTSLKKRLHEAEQTPASPSGIQNQLRETKLKLEAAEKLIEEKKQELQAYDLKVDEISFVEKQRQLVEDRLKVVEENNVRMKKEIKELQQQLEEKSKAFIRGSKELVSLQKQMVVKINEMYVINDRVAEILLEP